MRVQPYGRGERKNTKLMVRHWIKILFFIDDILAFSTFLLALGIVSGVVLRFGPESFTFIYNKWVGLTTASLIMAVVQATYCYITSFREGSLLALGGNSGNIIYDVSAPSHQEEKCSSHFGPQVVYRSRIEPVYWFF